MRKSALPFILLVLLIGAHLPAQAWRNNRKGGLSLGLKAGGGVAWQANTMGSSTINSGVIFGFHVGGLAQYPLHKYVEAEANLTFGRKGSGSEGVSFSLFYFNLPLYLNGTLPINRDVKAFVGVGPILSMAVAGMVSAGGESAAIDFTTTERLDIGLSAQAGLRFNKLQVSAYFDYGFYDINKAPEVPKSKGNSYAEELKQEFSKAFKITTKNRGVGISVAYTF